MSSPLEALLASIRKRSKSALWSQGVTLARAGAVAVESRGAEEIVLRVRAPGRVVPPTVVLYPTENEWECDCPSRVSPCEHVAASAIVLGEAQADDGATTSAEGDKPAPAASLGARVGYRFVRADGGLRLGRVLVAADGAETPLASPLRALLADPARAAGLQLEEADLRADALLETGARGPLAPGKLDGLLQILAGASRVTVDGVASGVSEEEIRPQAVLTDGPGSEVRLAISADPRVRAVVASGVALCEDDGRLALHRLAEIELGGDRLQHLPVRRAFGAADFAELLTVVLPDLAQRTVLDNRSARLPPVVRDLEPRIVLELNQLGPDAGGGIGVLPTLVYGSPPCARVDDPKLVHLRGPVPLRDPRRRARAVERLRAELDLLPGRRTTYGPVDTPRFVEKLKRWRGDLSGDAAGVVKPTVTLEPRLTPRHRRRRRGRHRRRALRAHLRRQVGRGRRRRRDGGRCAPGRRASASSRSPAAAGPRCRPAGCEARPARRRSARRARQDDGRLAPPRAAGARRRSATSSTSRRRPGLDRLAPLLRGLRAPPRARAARRSDGDAAPLPATAASTGSRSCATPASAASSPTTWASARRCRRSRVVATGGRSSCARRASSSTGRPSSRASGPSLKVAIYHGPGRALDRGRRRHAHELRAPAPRRARSSPRSHVGHRRPRRGAGDQEPRQPDRARRLRAAGGVPRSRCPARRSRTASTSCGA